MSYKQELLNNNQDLEILITGNSHTFLGIAPQEISLKAINIANDSRKLETDYFILRKNIKKLKKLKAVIIPISFYTFFINYLSESEKRLYFHFYKLNEYNQGWFLNRFIGNIPITEHVNNSVFNYKGAENISVLGKKKDKSKYKFQPNLIKRRIGDITRRLSDTITIRENLNFFDRIIKLCNVNDVNLVVLIPPYHPDFYKNGGEPYKIKINSLLRKYIKNSNIFLIDANLLNLEDDNYFKDVDHLNDYGASFLTKKIDSLIKLKI